VFEISKILDGKKRPKLLGKTKSQPNSESGSAVIHP